MMKQNKTFPFPMRFDLWPEPYFERFLRQKKRRKNTRVYMDSYHQCFIEDVEMYAFPPQLDSRDWQLSLQNDDDIIYKAFCRNYGHYCDRDVSEFFKSKLRELFYESKIGLEIFIKNGEVAFFQFPARSLRFSWLRGKYYQKFPKDKAKYINSPLQHKFPEDRQKQIYFDKEDFFILHAPKIFLKKFPKFALRSRMLGLAKLEETHINCQKHGVLFEGIKEEKLLHRGMFADVGCGRFERTEDITEYYYFYRLLKMAYFSAKVREEFLEQMNLLLDVVCKKLNRPNNKFVISGLISSDEYIETAIKLANDQISFEEVINRIYNNKI